MNDAEGQAEAMRAIANANADALAVVAKKLEEQQGKDAASLKVAELVSLRGGPKKFHHKQHIFH